MFDGMKVIMRVKELSHCQRVPLYLKHTQRDPGEYLAELQKFGLIAGDSLRRYAIDMHLHRYPQAVRNLFAAGPEHFNKVGFNLSLI